MTGRRIPPPQFDQKGTDDWPWPWSPGDYWKNACGEWEGCTPNGLHCGLRLHRVEEHADGTITVSPSILTNCGGVSWHGHLKAGVWESCE